MDENKKKVKSKKSLVLVIVIVATLLVGVIAALLFKKPEVLEKIMQPITKSIYSAKSIDVGQPNDDVGVMILSCDDTEEELSDARNISVTNRVGRYVEGTGAYTNSSFDTVIGQGVFRNMVDISEYKSVHISIYINDVSKLEDSVWIEFTSGVIYDEDEISWLIPPSKFQNGWNEFYLAIDGAYLTGTPDLETLFFYRMFSVGLEYGATIIYDNIYATNTEGVIYQPEAKQEKVVPDEWEETKSTEGKMIMSCNTVNIFETLSNTTVTTEKGEFVEGTGAFKMTGGELSSSYGAFVEPTDISAYKKGYIHLSLYVEDLSLLTDRLNFELTSGGIYDKDECQWLIQLNDLKNGWNEIWLPVEDAIITGNPNLSAINSFRIFTVAPKTGYKIILDNVYATMDGARDTYKETAATIGKMITSCNTINTFSKLQRAKVTTEKGEFVEGTGALKSTATRSALVEVNFKKPVDISAYSDGYLHFSVYINDTAYLGNELVVELTSSGTYDQDEVHFNISISGWKNGWNDITVPMSKGGISGKPNLSAIDYIRLYTDKNDEMPKRVFIVDDIRVLSAEEGYVSEETEAVDGKMIASCNTADIFSTLERVVVTKVKGEFVEGTGALKTVEYGETLLNGILTAKKDISAYKDGYIHMSFYVEDLSKLSSSVCIEFSSNTNPDVDEYQWDIAKASLKQGWNELWLDYAKAMTIGNPDLSSIKRIRVYTVGHKEGNIFIFDNIYATDKLYAGSGCSCGEAIYPGDILKANCLCYFSNSFKMKLTNQSVEGDYALQAKKPEAGMFGAFKTAIDISNYKDGYVHVSIYVDDVDKLSNNMKFELSSSGTNDKNEYNWEIKKSSLKDGWNELWLSIKDAGVTGTPDLTAINYFRLYSAQCDSELVLRLDDVYATTKKGE